MNHKPNLDDALMALRCGRLAFADFERRTRPVITAIAEHLLRHWRAPASVSVDDMRQELLLNVWIFVAHWDPQRLGPDGQPVPVSRYVTFNAIDKAKKWLHQQRNAYRRDDRSPSRIERPFSSFTVRDEEGRSAEDRLLDKLVAEPDVEQALERRESVVQRLPSAPRQLRPVVVALAATCDVDLAAEKLHSNDAACVALRLQSMNDARRAVTRALEAIA